MFYCFCIKYVEVYYYISKELITMLLIISQLTILPLQITPLLALIKKWFLTRGKYHYSTSTTNSACTDSRKKYHLYIIWSCPQAPVSDEFPIATHITLALCSSCYFMLKQQISQAISLIAQLIQHQHKLIKPHAKHCIPGDIRYINVH